MLDSSKDPSIEVTPEAWSNFKALEPFLLVAEAAGYDRLTIDYTKGPNWVRVFCSIGENDPAYDNEGQALPENEPGQGLIIDINDDGYGYFYPMKGDSNPKGVRGRILVDPRPEASKVGPATRLMEFVRSWAGDKGVVLPRHQGKPARLDLGRAAL